MRNAAIHQQTAALNGSPQYVGTIQSISPAVKDNSNTLVPFTIKPGVCYALVADAPCVFLAGQSGALQALSLTTGFPLGNTTPWPVILKNNEDRMQILANTGTVNVKVFEMPV